MIWRQKTKIFNKEKIKKSFSEVLGMMVYPENLYCISCGCAILPKQEDSLCPSCRKMILQDLPPQCRYCGRFLQPGARQLLCDDCQTALPLFTKGDTCCIYTGSVRKIVHELKYGGKSYLARNIAYIMSKKVWSLPKYDIIIPVPMYIKKERIRGYNQAELLGRYLSKFTGKACCDDFMERTRSTIPMSGLSLEARRDNIKNVLQVSKPKNIQGRTVLLVDDIFTTGSTVQECAKVLLGAGAKDIFVFTFAATGADQRLEIC